MINNFIKCRTSNRLLTIECRQWNSMEWNKIVFFSNLAWHSLIHKECKALSSIRYDILARKYHYQQNANSLKWHSGSKKVFFALGNDNRKLWYFYSALISLQVVKISDLSVTVSLSELAQMRYFIRNNNFVFKAEKKLWIFITKFMRLFILLKNTCNYIALLHLGCKHVHVHEMYHVPFVTLYG